MKEFEKLCLSARAVTVFKNVMSDPAVSALVRLLDAEPDRTAELIDLYSRFAAALYEKGENLTEYISRAVCEDENIFVRRCACGDESPLLAAAVENELDFFEALGNIECGEIAKYIKADIFLPQWSVGKAGVKADFHSKIANIGVTGYGMYAEHPMFMLKDDRITPVRCPDPQRLCDLSGYAQERQRVIDNTLALLDGKPCNNALLYGDAGSGKSSTVKAIVNEYYGRGLRLLEIKKNQLYSLPDVLEQLADNPLKFIIFIDDLSFSASDGDFGALKAVLEGGAAGKTKNIAIYATSNRRNLVRESFGDRDGDDIHLQDTVQEIMSLSARFGLKVTFARPNKNLYLSIVNDLSKQYNISMDANELALSAEAFALRNGGRSPRTAKQFIEYLASKG